MLVGRVWRCPVAEPATKTPRLPGVINRADRGSGVQGGRGKVVRTGGDANKEEEEMPRSGHLHGHSYWHKANQGYNNILTILLKLSFFLLSGYAVFSKLNLMDVVYSFTSRL